MDAQRLADFARIGADWLWEADSDDRLSYFSVVNARTGLELAGRIGLRRRDGATQEPGNLARIAVLEETVARRESFRDLVFRAGLGTERLHWCSISGEPRYDAAGAFLGYRGVGRDVTAQVEARQALEIQGRALEAILRAMPDGVQVIDKALTTLAVNDQLYEILGVANRKSPPDTNATFLTLLDMAKRGEYGPGDPEKLARERSDAMLQLLATQRGLTDQRQLKTGRWVETRLRALDDGTFLSLYRDITEAKEREAELKRQSALLRTIFENVPDGIAVFDGDSRLVTWNEGYADIIGADPAALRVGLTAREILISLARGGVFGPCDDLEAVTDRHLAALRAGRLDSVEWERPNGRAFEMRRGALPDGGAVSIYIDTTKRRRAEWALQELNATLEKRIAERTEALAEAERSQRAVIANVPGMVYRSKNGRDWTKSFVSEGCHELLGIAPEELTSGRVVYNDLIHPHEREVWLKAQADFDAGRRFEFEYRVRHADGTWRWVWDRAQPVRSASGGVVEIEGLILDVHVRKTAEQELARARDNLLDAAESLDDNLLLYDREDRLVLFTRHLYEQYPLADQYFVVGQTFEHILRNVFDSGALEVMPGQTKEQFIAERVARHRVADGMVMVQRLPNGRVLHISEHRTQSGGTVSIGRDVTVQLMIERQLGEAQRMDAIGQLTGGLAHALNNYLAVIIGNLDLLADREHADPEIQKLIEGAVGGALRGAELTRSLLAFSRRQPLDPKVQDIGERIVEVAKLLKRTIGEKIVVELSVSTGLWPVKIDGAQLDSCIVNLANNSRDAMPNGGTLSISVRNVAGGEDDALSSDCVLIELGDTGAGMSPETLAQAFEPFFTTKGPHRGSGLGLSMVHGFVHQSGGVIRIASEPGKGTTMRILLPRAGATDRPKTGVLPRGSERILVVEDNEHVRATAVDQLASLGYGVVGAESGDAALALLRTKSGEFDLVLTDIVMPGRIDGYELAQLVLERWPGKKVLLTSGFADDLAGSQDVKTLGLGMLRKPYRKADLARAIRAALTE